ncbi:MAG TPA: hypothetical protein VFG52_10210 [Xanthomonadales bacterium]|nr:hypothetical protein [Xanthomonadales bacterium]
MAMVEHQAEVEQRRSRAVITAWILAAVAVAIFAAFILSGVLAS